MLPGVYLDGVGAALLAAVLLTAVTLLLGPVMAVLSIPINFATLGLFTLAIIALLAKLVDALVGGLTIVSFGWAVAFAIIVALINGAFDTLLLSRLGR